MLYRSQIINMMMKIVQSFVRSPVLTCRFGYVRKKQLDQIKSRYGSSRIDDLKMKFNVGKHIVKTGMTNMISESKFLANIMRKKINKEVVNEEEKKILKDFRLNIERFKPIALINALPFSGPLLLLYMHVYPGSIPTWFCVDEEYDAAMKERVLKQQAAILYFKEKKITKDTLNIDNLSLEQLKKLSELIIGFCADGTHGLRKVKRNYSSPHFMHAKVSRWMILRKIKIKMRLNQKTKEHTKHMSFEDQVKYKFGEIMEGRLKLQFTPITQTEEFPEKRNLVEAQSKQEDSTKKDQKPHV